MSKRGSILSLIIVVLIVAVFGVLAVRGMAIGRYDILPLSRAIRQGLDLRGGVYTVYEAKDENVEGFNDKMSTAIGIIRNRLDKKGYTEATISRQGATRIRVEIPDISDPKAVLSIIGEPALLQFVEPDGTVIMEGSAIVSARASRLPGEGNEVIVAFELNEAGTKAFAEATARLIGQRITILLDGKEISSPTVEDVIPTGSGYIRGMESVEAAQTLAIQIESGALPLEFTQLEVRTISATLGENALRQALLAGAIGIAALFVYMIIYYRLPGLIADIALIIYIEIVLYALAILPSVQLTLPGVAGIILSVGMAVDANVIIFERIREEMRAGKTLRSAVESGFKKAFRTILDSNVTTAIAAFVLMYFGTGSIKGFAVTLALGITVSMFTAITVTRLLIRIMINLRIDWPGAYGRGMGALAKEAK
ncbi:MAG: protein translocase subunit SecD [Christensenellales bacterium]|jgi:preprotein translocase subunit SecD